MKSRSTIKDQGQERELLYSLLPLAERDKKCPVIWRTCDSSQGMVTNVCSQRKSNWLLDNWWQKVRSQNINTLPKMSPIPGTFEVMTNLDVIRSIHVPSLPGCEVGDVQGFSSNEQDQEENMVDRVQDWVHLEGKIQSMGPTGTALIRSELRSCESKGSQPTQNEVDSGGGEGGRGPSHAMGGRNRYGQCWLRNGPRLPGQSIHRTRKTWATGLWSSSPQASWHPHFLHHPTRSLFSLYIPYLLQTTSLPLPFIPSFSGQSLYPMRTSLTPNAYHAQGLP